MKRKKNLNCSTAFSDTGKMQLSYQQGRGYWDFGDLSAQRGVFDLPKHTVPSVWAKRKLWDQNGTPRNSKTTTLHSMKI